jgi:DNA-binding NarL/FixJ family response regulator
MEASVSQPPEAPPRTGWSTVVPRPVDGRDRARPAAPPVRVVVADDDALVRRVVGRALARDGCAVVAEAADRMGLLRQAARHRPDVIVVDVRRFCFGRDLVRDLTRPRGDRPGTRVLVLTTHRDDGLLLRALTEGARGYLVKEVGTAPLAAAVRAVAAGHVVLPPDIAGTLVDGAGVPATADGSALDQLTRTEQLVLRMIAEGMTTAQIARRLGITSSTVKSHVSHLLGKLEVQDRVQAVVLAYRRGLVSASQPDVRGPWAAGAEEGM